MTKRIGSGVNHLDQRAHGLGVVGVDLLERLLDPLQADIHHLEGDQGHKQAGKVLAPPGHKHANRTLKKDRVRLAKVRVDILYLRLLHKLRSSLLELRHLLCELVDASAP